MVLVLVDEMDVDVGSRNRSLSMFDSFLTPLVLMLLEKGIQLQIKAKMSLEVKQRGDKASETGMPSRNKLWLPELGCFTLSEVFTRAITVIIISTIPCNALSYAASQGQRRYWLPALGFGDFSQLLVVSGILSKHSIGGQGGGGDGGEIEMRRDEKTCKAVEKG